MTEQLALTQSPSTSHRPAWHACDRVEVEHLLDDVVGHLIVDGAFQEDDAVFQEHVLDGHLAVTLVGRRMLRECIVEVFHCILTLERGGGRVTPLCRIHRSVLFQCLGDLFLSLDVPDRDTFLVAP